MKAIKNIVTIVVLTLGMLTSYAKGDLTKGNQIVVSDNEGKIIYNGFVNFDGKLINLFDFSHLKNGNYTVEIDKDFQIELNTIIVKNNRVTLVENSKKTIFKPSFKTKGNTILISKVAFETDVIELEIYFEDKLIHTETIENSNTVINRVYKLDVTQNGNYNAVVKTNGRRFVERFKI